MADQFYDDIPARANNIGTDVDQIELSLGYIKDVLQQITGGWHDSTLTNIIPGNKGLYNRSWIQYGSVSSVTIEPAIYDVIGGSNKMCYWDSQVTFLLGSGGSNSASEDLGNNELHYIYIDDSLLESNTTNVLQASYFLNSQEAPDWIAAKHGRYPTANGTYVTTNDRCIGCVLTNGSGQIREFHSDGNYVLYADQLAGGTASKTGYDYEAVSLSTTWDDVYLPIPGFCTKAHVTFYAIPPGAASSTPNMYWRTNGQTGTVGHLIAHANKTNNEDNVVKDVNSANVICDSSQIIEVKYSASGSTASVYVDGWYYPVGM